MFVTLRKSRKSSSSFGRSNVQCNCSLFFNYSLRAWAESRTESKQSFLMSRGEMILAASSFDWNILRSSELNVFSEMIKSWRSAHSLHQHRETDIFLPVSSASVCNGQLECVDLRWGVTSNTCRTTSVTAPHSLHWSDPVKKLVKQTLKSLRLSAHNRVKVLFTKNKKIFPFHILMYETWRHWMTLQKQMQNNESFLKKV